MQTTIYIRKENEEYWNSIDDKSNYVNALLSKEQTGNKVGHENVGRLQDEIVKRKSSNTTQESIESKASVITQPNTIPDEHVINKPEDVDKAIKAVRKRTPEEEEKISKYFLPVTYKPTTNWGA